jgi:CRP-like cAMP-binding protein
VKAEMMEQIQLNMEEEFHDKGTEIVAQGDPISKLRFVVQGKVEVQRNIKDKNEVVEIL